jgi:hypothetical protein
VRPPTSWPLTRSRLCNGVVIFEDTGDLLPDGRVIAPHRDAASGPTGITAVGHYPPGLIV